jgi:hypothetical protein
MSTLAVAGHQGYSKPLDLFFNKETENEVPVGSFVQCDVNVKECIEPVSAEMEKCYLPMIETIAKFSNELSYIAEYKDYKNIPDSIKKTFCCSRNVAETCLLDAFARKLSKSCYDQFVRHLRKERTQMELLKVFDCNTKYAIGSTECN